MTPEEQTEVTLRGDLVKLGHLPLERRIRILNDAWNVLVRPGLLEMTLAARIELLGRATAAAPGEVPVCEVLDLTVGTATWHEGQRAC